MRLRNRGDETVSSCLSNSLKVRREVEVRKRRGPTPDEVHKCPELYGAMRLAAVMGRVVKKEE